MSGRPLIAGELLRIDYEAERRKLATSTLDAAWRVPAELVRRALRTGAARVAIERSRDGLVVRDDGPPLAQDLASALATLRDSGVSAEERHAALLRLEPEPGLLAASLQLECARAAGENRLLLRGAVLDGAACRALAEALRFGPPGLSLDGRALPRGFGAAWAEGPLPAPLRGGLSLTAEAAAEIAVVLDSVVITRASLPDGPPFSAWVDARSLGDVGGTPSPAGLRAALAPHEPTLTLAAVDLALAAVPLFAGGSGSARERLLDLLLTAARRGARRGEILRAPLLPAIDHGETVSRSLLDLGREAEAAPGRVVCALEPEVDPEEMLLPEGTVYRIGPGSRARISALLGVRFRPAVPKDARGGLVARLRRAGRDLGRAARRALAWLRHPAGGRPVAAGDLRPQERALLRALGPGVALTTGSGPPVRKAAEWRLPRENPVVSAAARAVAEDPRWAYPAALALFEGQRPLPPGCGGAWSEA